MTYSVKEMYYTLQGEGIHSGRAAVFLRFAGCNLWTGKEDTREKADCKFCDTQFVGTDGENGGKFEFPMELAKEVARTWNEVPKSGSGKPFVVCTGGEPMLQLDDALVRCLKHYNFEIAIETNGTLPVCEGVDWICVSPKSDRLLRQTSGNELKLVYPQPENKPKQYEHLEFDHFFLSPRDVSFEPPEYKEGLPVRTPTEEAIEYCLHNPKWRLSLQTHKLLNIK